MGGFDWLRELVKKLPKDVLDKIVEKMYVVKSTKVGPEKLEAAILKVKAYPHVSISKRDEHGFLVASRKTREELEKALRLQLGSSVDLSVEGPSAKLFEEGEMGDELKEQTMTVNIAQVPRPFRIITKEQGKQEYGMPFYEALSQDLATSLKGIADRIKKEKPDARTARDWVKDTFSRLGLEPVERAGFLTQLMRMKDANAIADALYDVSVETPQAGVVVGEDNVDPDMMARYEKVWDALTEDGRGEFLEKAGYDGDEKEAYQKFEWGGLPPAVRTRVEVVMEAVAEENPGAAALRVPFHKRKGLPIPLEPEAEAPPDEEEPEVEPEASPEGTAVFETVDGYMDFFKKMSGLNEADEPRVSPEDPDVLDLITKSKQGDKAAQTKLLSKYERLIWKSAHDVGRRFDLGADDVEDLNSEGQVALLQDVVPKYDPSKGTKFSTFLTNMLRSPLNRAAERLVRGRGVSMSGEVTPLDVAKAVSSAEELPKECSLALKSALEKLKPEYQKVLTLRFGLGGEAPMDLRSVATKLNTSRQSVLNWEKEAVKALLNLPETADLWKKCKDFLGREPEAAERLPRKPGEWELTKEDIRLLEDDELALFNDDMTFEWPADLVAEGMASILQAEGVKVKRNGRKVTIPVNEYGRAKKAFEKAGLTMPKKYVSHEADNIRKMAKLGGQYGGPVLDKPW